MTGSAFALQGYCGLKVSKEKLLYILYIHLVYLVYPSSRAPITTCEKRHN